MKKARSKEIASEQNINTIVLVSMLKIMLVKGGHQYDTQAIYWAEQVINNSLTLHPRIFHFLALWLS